MTLFSRIAFLTLVGLLTSCASEPERTLVIPPRVIPASPTDAALNEAERLLNQGDIAGARDTLTSMPKELDFTQRTRKQVLNAELALADKKPLQALQVLPRPWQVSEPALAARVERVRARAFFSVGDAVGAVRTLAVLEPKLTAPADIHDNRRLLWEGLKTARFDALGTRLAQADTATQGWIELARLDRRLWPSTTEREQALSDWRKRFSGHPGEAFIAGLDATVLPTDAIATESKPWFSLPGFGGGASEPAFALLLPLSGPYAASAESVRDGFIAATLTRSLPASVRVYDSGPSADTLRSAYEQALDEGARVVVGPLRKEDVAVLAELGDPPVPMLALNYLDASKPAPDNLYQWGLTPEDEARQAALHATSQGKLRALAFAPEGDWGQRVLAAFEQQLLAAGGRIVASARYAAGVQDYGEPLRQLLGIDASTERQRALTATLGLRLQFEPRRRDDADFIFFAARPDQARQIASQLRFNRALGLPIYSLAQIYDGRDTADLNGVRFCDMPWMLDAAGPWAQLRGDFTAAFPKRGKDSTRLQAMGYDAHTLADLLLTGRLTPGTALPAASGTLELRAGGVIMRGLSCAQIAGDTLKRLDANP